MTDKPTRPGDKSETASALRDAAGGLASKAEAAVTTSTEGFVETAAISDLYEIEASKIALQRSRRPDVKQFAQQMVEDHTKTSQMLKSTVTMLAKPVTPPLEMDSRHKGLIDDLKGAADEDFDHRYIAQQQSAHSGAITLFKTYRDRGEDQSLRSLCAKALPVLEQHMHMVEQMKKAA